MILPLQVWVESSILMFPGFTLYFGENVENEQRPFPNYKKKKIKCKNRQAEKDYKNEPGREGK